jgi:hypothetical protein
VVRSDVAVEKMAAKIGKLRLNIFVFSGSTITTSFGKRKYASLVSIALS